MRDDRQRGPTSDELGDEPVGGLGRLRPRRWLGRRRAEDSTEAPSDLDEPARPEPDWNAVITDEEPIGGSDWADWPPDERPSEEVTDEGAEKEFDWSEWAPPAPPDPEAASPDVTAASAAVEAGEASEHSPETARLEDAEAATAVDPGQALEAAGTAGGAEVAGQPTAPAEATGTIEAGEPASTAEPAEAAGTTEATEVADQPTESPDAAPPADRADELSVAIWETVSEPAIDGNGSAPTGSAETAAVPPPTDVTASSEVPPEEEVRYRTTPSWPPPRKPRIGLGLLSLAVMVIMIALLVTNGQIGTSSDDDEKDLESLPALETNPDAVPRDWIVYRHPSGGFGISYPPGWTVRDDGTAVEIRHPSSPALLRIDQRRPPGETDPEDDWLEQERAFSARSNGYRRLQLSEASYQGHLAALWEYSFAEGSVGVHAADLQFVTKKDRFILRFRGPVAEWQGLLPNFQGFLSSFKPPK